MSDWTVVRLEHGSPQAAAVLLSHLLGVALEQTDAAGSESRSLSIGGIRLELVGIPSGARDGRLHLDSGDAARAALGGDGHGVAALGIATVDTDRYASERGWSLARGRPDFHLGAVVQRVAGRPMGSLTVLLLEPDTEGRIAASLARLGEGPVALYVRPVGGSAAAAARAIEAGARTSPAGAGPFGPERLLLDGPPWGPHLVLVDSGTVWAAGPHDEPGQGVDG